METDDSVGLIKVCPHGNGCQVDAETLLASRDLRIPYFVCSPFSFPLFYPVDTRGSGEKRREYK
jgi:hypothetical protein